MRINRLSVGNEGGATLLESVVVLPLFLLMVIVSFDLIRLVYDSLTVRYVTASVMRRASIGEMDQTEIRQAVISLAGILATTVGVRYLSGPCWNLGFLWTAPRGSFNIEAFPDE